MSFRVLLIQPRIYDFSAFDLWVRPLGWLNLAARLRSAGAEVAWVDAVDRFQPAAADLPTPSHHLQFFGCGHYHREFINKPEILSWVPRRYKVYGLPRDRFLSLLASQEKPDVILTGCTMTYWYPGVLEAVQMVRSLWPGVPVGIAGIYAILCGDHARQYSGADFVYSNSNMNELVKTVASLAGHSPREQIESVIVSPAYDLLGSQKSLPLQTSTGCPFDCTYCASKKLSPLFRQFPKETLLKMIQECVERYGTTDWAFYDDALLIGKEKHFIPLMEALIDRGYGFRLHSPNALHCRMIDRQVAQLMKAVGFRTVRLGLEFAQADRQNSTGGKVSWKDFTDAIRHLREAGFTAGELGTYVMAGHPEQTLEEVAETCLRVHDQGCPVRLTLYSPIPGTVDFARLDSSWQMDPSTDPLLHNPSLAPYRAGSLYADRFKSLQEKVLELNRTLGGDSKG